MISRRKALPFFIVCTSLMGCASDVSKFLGFGAPPSLEKCTPEIARAMGVSDGRTGQRPGERLEFWAKDCRLMGAPLDRKIYDEGYAEGLHSYCSCEGGFLSGVKDEFSEFKGQYYMCPKPVFARFLQGHEEGKKYVADPLYSAPDGPHTRKYFEEVILEKGKEVCLALAAVPLPIQDDSKNPKGTSPKFEDKKSNP